MITSNYTVVIPSQIDIENVNMFQLGTKLYWPNRNKITQVTVCAIHIDHNEIAYDVTHEDNDPIQSFTLRGLSLKFMRENFFHNKHDAERNLLHTRTKG